MPSNRALYNEEVIQAHREALATLRELLATEKDPAERRKLANAILRARPVKEVAPPSPCSEGDRAFGSEAAEGRKSRSARRVSNSLGSERADESALSALSEPDASARLAGGSATALHSTQGTTESSSADAVPTPVDAPTHPQPVTPHRANSNHNNNFRALNRKVSQLTHQLNTAPDPRAALRGLAALISTEPSLPKPNTTAAEAP